MTYHNMNFISRVAQEPYHILMTASSRALYVGSHSGDCSRGRCPGRLCRVDRLLWYHHGILTHVCRVLVSSLSIVLMWMTLGMLILVLGATTCYQIFCVLISLELLGLMVADTTLETQGEKQILNP